MSIKTVIETIRSEEPLTMIEKRMFVEWSMTIHTGKMEGIPSISTSCFCNDRCKTRKENPKTICADCYVTSYLYRKSLIEKLEVNTKFYTTYELAPEDVPYINFLYCRYESFGDLNNTLQFKNFCTIARKNRHCTFVLWTKNPDIIKKAINNGVKIPKNLKIILSEIFTNNPINIKYFRKIKKIFPFVNKLFAVYEKEYIKEHKIVINCGLNNCLNCLKCYDQNNKTTLIREIKK